MKNSEKSAFVIPADNIGVTNQLEYSDCNGLTKREYIATEMAKVYMNSPIQCINILQRIQILFTGKCKGDIVVYNTCLNRSAELAIKAADELLKQLES